MRVLMIWLILVPLAAESVEWDDAALQEARSAHNGSYEPIGDDDCADDSLQNHLNGVFGFRAYKTNYYLPISYADRPYPSYDPADAYRQLEVEYQYSFAIDLFADLFNAGEIYGIAMTSHGFWQMYSPSSPFREVNYNPEVYVSFPIRNGRYGLKTFRFAYAHASNGQGDIETADLNASTCSECDAYWRRSRTRAWNYLSAVLGFQAGAFFADLTLWAKIDVTMFGYKDENPDILDYYGWGQLNTVYLRGAHKFELFGRLNPVTGYGAVEAGWSYPVFGRESVFWYVKSFSGYGESLIDYDRYVNKIGFGFSFFR